MTTTSNGSVALIANQAQSSPLPNGAIIGYATPEQLEKLSRWNRKVSPRTLQRERKNRQKLRAVGLLPPLGPTPPCSQKPPEGERLNDLNGKTMAQIEAERLLRGRRGVIEPSSGKAERRAIREKEACELASAEANLGPSVNAIRLAFQERKTAQRAALAAEVATTPNDVPLPIALTPLGRYVANRRKAVRA
jgi:hypothetical protein